MKKNITKKAAVFLLSAMVAAQSGLSVQAAALTEGNWEQTDKGWKFLNRDRQPYTGWIRTASGWYYLSAEDGSLVTGWKNINGLDYYFTPASEGIEGQMKVGWYQSPQGEWYFFDNSTDTHEEGRAVSGWNWIDGYCYYFSKTEAGKGAKMAANTTTPDGYKVNASGQWVSEDGTAQYRQSGGYRTKAVSGSTTVTSSGSSSSSDSDSDSDKTPVTPVTPEVKEEYQYLLMNIPYADFYESEVKGNEEDVDFVSSATLNKPRTGNLVAGSYHTNEDGTTIDGVTFPVRVKKGTDLSAFKKVTDSDSVTIKVVNRGQEKETTYTGKDALFENEDFAYYEMSEIPSYYKELTINGDVLIFSEVKGTTENVSGVSAEVATSSNYGDYQLTMNGLPESLSSSDTTVYGVVLHTKEGTDYGMRHLENIWLRTSIAWASGFTEDSHGSPLSSAHYESMMGKNITGVTYYTSEGVMEIPFTQAVYVPVKIAQEIAVAQDAMVSNAEAAITGLDALPADFEPVYSVSGLENTEVAFEVKNGKLTWTGSPLPGKYTLTIQDHSGKYATISVSFILSAETSPVKVQAKEGSDGSEYELAKVDTTITDAQVKAYAKSVTSVKVGETEYAATGRGSVQIVKEDGTIDTSVKVNGNYLFESQVPTDITIQADGYPAVTGTITVTAHYQYVLMNIPYSAFYANELENNEIAVDVVSSATMKRPLNKEYTAGTYHTKADGSVISGVTYPVKIDEKALAGLTKADSEDALYSNVDYAYYVLAATPSYYKEAKVGDNQIVSFSQSKTTLKTIEYTSNANITTTKLEGNHIMHGDYEVRFTDLANDCILRNTETVVYGAILHTVGEDENDTKDYGLRCQENIFNHKYNNFEIAWATGTGDGFQTTVKNATLSYEAYADMMGRSLTGLTVYTDQGTVEITFENKKYVPIKSAENKVSVTAPETYAIKTTYNIEQLLFSNYEVSVTDSDDKSVTGFTVDTDRSEVTWTNAVKAGSYKLVFTDKNGAYAPVAASFEVQSSTITDFKVSDAGVAGPAKITGLTLPEGYDAKYVVTNASGVEMSDFYVNDNKITWSEEAEPGVYTLTVSDNNNKYISISTSFAIIANETKAGEAEVSVVSSRGAEIASYTANVSVVYDPVSGKIVSVEDNNTDYGDNDNEDYWEQALETMVSWLKGKTVSELENADVTKIDGVTGATCTAKGIKNAVLNALGSTNSSAVSLADVTEAADPAAIKFYKNEELVKTVDVDADELESLGSLEILDVVLDPKYEDNWNEFTIVVVDADDKELDNTAEVVDDTFTVTLADGRVITVSFSFETEENEEEKKADEVVADDTTNDTAEDTNGENSDQTVSEDEVTEEEKEENGSEEENKSEETGSEPEEEKAEDSSEDNDGSEETEDKSGESGATEDTGKEEEESKNKDQDGDSVSGGKEDAADVPEVGETTQETEVAETDTLTKNE